MNCSICNSENVKYKNSKKEFAVGKLLCRRCYNTLYKQTDEYREWKSNYDKNRFENNKEKIILSVKKHYIENRNKELEYRRNYYKDNKSSFLHYSKLRKHKKKNATPSWLSKEQIESIKQIYKEAYDLTLSTGTQYVVDHIIPLNGRIVSGLHVPWNLQILTEYDNRVKSNKLVEEIV